MTYVTEKPNTTLIVLHADAKMSCPKCKHGVTLTRAAVLTIPRDDRGNIGYSCSECKVQMVLEQLPSRGSITGDAPDL